MVHDHHGCLASAGLPLIGTRQIKFLAQGYSRLMRLLEDDQKSKYSIRTVHILQVTLITQLNTSGSQQSHSGMQFISDDS